ncbi:MAG: adenylate/guanylate cyclase domain-containing protein [Rhizobiales bacterium]|nr:adenylate/guanylate cyclase domain-containing protein [Hyphomicrobiales bacterium]
MRAGRSWCSRSTACRPSRTISISRTASPPRSSPCCHACTIRVISRAGSSDRRDEEPDPWTIVSDLQVNYVLTGNVRRAGDRVRVFAKLSAAADRSQLWSHIYDRRFADLFQVQEEIAEAIVVAFGGEFLRAEWRRAGMASLNGERQSRGDTRLEFGVALHIGEVMYGNIGAPDRVDFTVIGPTVNLASRLEALCRPLNCPVLTSPAFKNACKEPLASLGRHRLPNIAKPIDVHTLVEFAAESSTFRQSSTSDRKA